MEINLSGAELKYLLTILNNELVEIGKEIHRTDALTYKQELTEKEAVLSNIISKLKLIET